MKKFLLTVLCEDVLVDEFDSEIGEYLEKVRDSVLYAIEDYENLTADHTASSYMELTGSRHTIPGQPGLWLYCNGVVVEEIVITNDELESTPFNSKKFSKNIVDSIRGLGKMYFKVKCVSCVEVKE